MTQPAVPVPSPAAAATAAADRSTITLLAFASFCSGAALRVCDGLLPRMGNEFGMTAGSAGAVVITFTIAYGVSQLMFGPLGDRFGKARVISISLFCSALGGLACALAPGFDALLGLRVLWGIAAGGIIPLAMAWIGDTVHYEQRQATLARLLMGTVSGMSAGQLAGGLFADSSLGWRGAFAVLSVGYLAVALMLLPRLRRVPRPVAREAGARFAFLGQMASVPATPWARVVLAAALVEGTFLFGALAFLPSYLHQRFGTSLSAAGALVALFSLGGLLYALVAPHIIRRLGERRMVLAGGAIMGAGFIGWYLMPFAWMAGPIAFAVGFGTYLFHNTLQANATQMAPAIRGTGMALFAFCLFVGQGVGAWMAGATFDHLGAATLLLVPAATLAFTGWAFAWALLRRAQASRTLAGS